MGFTHPGGSSADARQGHRAEGEEQALRIRADADRQRDKILSAAYKEAEKTRGEGDAVATRTYSHSVINRTPLTRVTRLEENMLRKARSQRKGGNRLSKFKEKRYVYR